MEKINLKTTNGKTGYRIKALKIIGEQPGTETVELVCQIFSKEVTPTASVDFTDSNLMGVAYLLDSSATSTGTYESIIFDNEVTNQNIFICAFDVSGSSRSTNYYLELETIALSDLQSTQLTLKNLRTLASR